MTHAIAKSVSVGSGRGQSRSYRIDLTPMYQSQWLAWAPARSTRISRIGRAVRQDSGLSGHLELCHFAHALNSGRPYATRPLDRRGDLLQPRQDAGPAKPLGGWTIADTTIEIACRATVTRGS